MDFVKSILAWSETLFKYKNPHNIIKRTYYDQIITYLDVFNNP